MGADCHMHMVLDSVDWKKAMARHKVQPDDGYIRKVLATYRDLGYTYLRDGGDKYGASVRARELAGAYGITYRSPIAPISMVGHYGGFIGCQVADLQEYADLVKQFRRRGADFIKIMISGLMDFDRFGVLTEDGLEENTIRQMIHIAHAEGFSVMAHANGARVIAAAARAGVDSVEHGAYADDDALAAMVEHKVVWVPTLSTIGELRRLPPEAGGRSRTSGSGRQMTQAFESQGSCRAPQQGQLRRLPQQENKPTSVSCADTSSREEVLGGADSAAMPWNDRKVGAAGEILESALENVKAFTAMGGLVAPGTDAGAFAVPHGCGTEAGYLRAAGVTDGQMEQGIRAIKEKF